MMVEIAPPLTPHQRSKKADAKAVKRHRQRAGQLVAEVPSVTGEQKLEPNKACDQNECARQHGRRREARNHRAAGNADHRRQRPSPNHAWNDWALRSMRQIRADGGRHDDRNRGSEAELHAHIFRHP
jgi:hypothetical protein